MKTFLIASAMLLIPPLIGFAQPTPANSKSTLSIDTNRVCIPLDVARLIAIDLEHFDRVRLEIPVLESIVSLQKKEASIMVKHNGSLAADLKDTRNSLTTQIDLTDKWQGQSKTHKNQRNVAAAIGVVLLAALIVK